jgi:hypothetical protein
VNYDLSSHKNVAMRVRFSITLGAGPTAASWNIDDVVVERRGWAVDADACTTDTCDPQTGEQHDEVDIDDGDDCTVDVCQPYSGTAHTPRACDAGTDGCCPPGCEGDDPDCG